MINVPDYWSLHFMICERQILMNLHVAIFNLDMTIQFCQKVVVDCGYVWLKTQC